LNTVPQKPPSNLGEAAGAWTSDHDTIVASIAAAELMVASGETVDLIPLGERVAAYCETLRDAAPNDRDESRRRLGELVQRMDDLTNAVETRLDDVRRRLSWEVSGRAATAYGRGEPGQS
jgi:hypothetical protein